MIGEIYELIDRVCRGVGSVEEGQTSVPIPEGFALYKRVGSILARPWTQQDAADYLNGVHSNVSVSEADKHTACMAQGMLAMNPDNCFDCWYIAPPYFAKHYAGSQEKADSPPAREPLAKRCYVMSESHLSGARVIIGFNTLQDASEAHQWISNLPRVST